MSEFEVVLKRQWEMLRDLTTTETGLTLVDMSKKFGVSEKTIKRDLLSLRAVFGKWKSVNEAHGRKRYRYDTQSLTFNETLSYDELFALYLGTTFANALIGTKVGADVASGLDKIGKTLRPKARDLAERFAPVCRHMGPYETRLLKVIDAVYTAMRNNYVLTIQYRSLKSKEYKSYEICPYKFHYQNNAIYLVGLCCADRKVKFWKINRLHDANILASRKFRIPEGFNEKDHLVNSFVLFGKTEDSVETRVTLRLTGFAARIFEEEPPCKIETQTKLKNGALIVELDTEVNEAFYNAILNYGENAEILAPQNMREHMIAKLNALSSNYMASNSASTPLEYYRRLDALTEEDRPEDYSEGTDDDAFLADDEQVVSYDVTIDDLAYVGEKRRRGRPRKHPIAIDRPKRKRGRPRKPRPEDQPLPQVAGLEPIVPVKAEKKVEKVEKVEKPERPRRPKPLTGRELTKKLGKK